MLAVERTAYLTIDEGPAGDFRQKVEYLNAKGIRAIWFCMGEALEKFSDEAIFAIKAGHWIGNGSYDHTDLSAISLPNAREQIGQTDQIINELYTEAKVARTAKLFRFPYMQHEAMVEHFAGIDRVLGELGYSGLPFENSAGIGSEHHVTFTCDTFDLSDASAFSQEGGLLYEAGNHIIKLHDWIGLAPFQTLIDKLLSIGLGFGLPQEVDAAADAHLAYI
ncbi:polysaccharide deacetylase family protein [Paenibacillus paridis]|uniref:polysaccharide deacetylase family protein n=1 Tax=Paenibacillus paridis TaxID=2583376 RepID=UPI00111F24C8|nr:polysaccharide deacetylase family protein [Paenibacillus paridis]